MPDPSDAATECGPRAPTEIAWRPPGFVFHPSDWMGDSRLQMCSEGAQFLWFRLMALAWQSPKPGRLLRADGSPMTIVQAARLMGADASRATTDLAELLSNQVAHQEQDGTIYCPRLLRDYEKSARVRDARRKGGSQGHKGAEFGGRGAEAGRLYGRGHTTPRIEPSQPATDAPPVAEQENSKPAAKPRRKRAEAECPIEPGEVFVAWNAMAKAAGLPQAMRLSDKRRKDILVRARDPFWLENWRAALERVSVSAFCRGGGDRGWVADLDWFIGVEAVTKLIEGKFDDRIGSAKRNGKPMLGYYADQTAKALDD